MVAAAEKGIRTIAAEVLLGGGIYRGFRLPSQIWVVLPVGVISITTLASFGGLFFPTTLALSTIKSLTEGEIGQCSP